MAELKQICVHYLSGNCKYGASCTKIHITPNTEVLQEIERKGPVVCNFYPNCKFTQSECKKLHIDIENQYEKEMTEMRRLYLKLVNYDTSDNFKNDQIERIKFMIKTDLELIKDTLSCIQS